MALPFQRFSPFWIPASFSTIPAFLDSRFVTDDSCLLGFPFGSLIEAGEAVGVPCRSPLVSEIGIGAKQEEPAKR
ncbi:hypothetical protein NDU88_005691 [Pleurodeles waltl]|uniref:Uncharacterized protein n=1 Tax=Pleurodeles waltl TaxID=8319 RepID=A0AAV7UIV2_PLEWA|nr:hypothetical protein NDU88_005691 [Pleurodeles waltl]